MNCEIVLSLFNVEELWPNDTDFLGIAEDLIMFEDDDFMVCLPQILIYLLSVEAWSDEHRDTAGCVMEYFDGINHVSSEHELNSMMSSVRRLSVKQLQVIQDWCVEVNKYCDNYLKAEVEDVIKGFNRLRSLYMHEN